MVAKITGAEVIHLLDMVTCINRRKFTDDEGSLWYQLLKEHTYDECYEAFQEYLREDSDTFLTPALILKSIKRNRVRRITEGLNEIEPPNGLDGKQYLAWLDEKKQELAQPPAGFRPSGVELTASVGERRELSN